MQTFVLKVRDSTNDWYEWLLLVNDELITIRPLSSLFTTIIKVNTYTSLDQACMS